MNVKIVQACLLFESEYLLLFFLFLFLCKWVLDIPIKPMEPCIIHIPSHIIFVRICKPILKDLVSIILSRNKIIVIPKGHAPRIYIYIYVLGKKFVPRPQN